MQYVHSRDGTALAYQRTGTGPPLLLVHGTGTDHRYWAPLLPALASRFTVYALDRRGRGHSGDTLPYALAREGEDLAAVLAVLGDGVRMLAHSYGALCVLAAAGSLPPLRRLMLYEPPLPTTVAPAYLPDTLTRYQALLAAGRAEAALGLLDRVGQTPAAEIQARPSPAARVGAAPTIAREILAARGFVLDPVRLRDLPRPVRLLVGGTTLPVYRAASQLLHGALPHSQLVVLPGVGHAGALTAPALVARAVLDFFSEDV